MCWNVIHQGECCAHVDTANTLKHWQRHDIDFSDKFHILHWRRNVSVWANQLQCRIRSLEWFNSGEFLQVFCFQSLDLSTCRSSSIYTSTYIASWNQCSLTRKNSLWSCLSGELEENRKVSPKVIRYISSVMRPCLTFSNTTHTTCWSTEFVCLTSLIYQFQYFDVNFQPLFTRSRHGRGYKCGGRDTASTQLHPPKLSHVWSVPGNASAHFVSRESRR